MSEDVIEGTSSQAKKEVYRVEFKHEIWVRADHIEDAIAKAQFILRGGTPYEKQQYRAVAVRLVEWFP